MFLSPRYHRQLAGCRVCRLVAATVFATIVAIEVLILLPSYQNERDRAVGSLAGQARAFAEGLLAAEAPPAPDAALPPGVLGLEVWREGGTARLSLGDGAGGESAIAAPPVLLADGSRLLA